ncbi:hypothetical protein [Fundidesulfovibrio agrisoli]|uniref:hypothetical protein n=1 Tax=Fundidesulfovibrio agrisoli TaxID=2922717 RepID=UPI001FAC001C|nr:hypothetical protein [Fundidesulfovibrio agrisoli]
MRGVFLPQKSFPRNPDMDGAEADMDSAGENGGNSRKDSRIVLRRLPLQGCIGYRR